MFKINNHKLQNKRTGEKIGPEKITVQYLIRILQMGNLLEKKITVHVQLYSTREYYYHCSCYYRHFLDIIS